MTVTNIVFESGYVIISFSSGAPEKHPIADLLRAEDIPSLATSKITSGEFTSARLGTGAVTAAEIDTDAVTTNKIQDSAVTVGKLASALLGYLLTVGRVDFSNADYCKVA